MDISECKIGTKVRKSKTLTGRYVSGVVVGFITNIVDETIPVIKWGYTGIKSSIHHDNILKDIDNEL